MPCRSTGFAIARSLLKGMSNYRPGWRWCLLWILNLKLSTVNRSVWLIRLSQPEWMSSTVLAQSFRQLRLYRKKDHQRRPNACQKRNTSIVHHHLHCTGKKRWELCMCKTTSYLATNMVLGCLHCRLLRLRRRVNRTKAQLRHRAHARIARRLVLFLFVINSQIIVKDG